MGYFYNTLRYNSTRFSSNFHNFSNFIYIKSKKVRTSLELKIFLNLFQKLSALIEKRHFELTLIGHCFSILSFIFFMGFQIDFRTQVK